MRKELDITFDLIRHGLTNRNEMFDLIGQSTEEPLNATGIQQVNKLAARFKKEDIVYDYLYCSPYVRAQQTGKIILEVMPKNTPFITVPEIREINQGSGKDKSRSELYSQPGFTERMTWEGMGFKFDEGENLYAVQYRAWKWLNDQIISNPQTRIDKPLKIAIITHGMTVKSLLQAVMQFDHRMTWKIRTDNTAIASFRLLKGEFYIYSINDTAHLQGEIQ